MPQNFCIVLNPKFYLPFNLLFICVNMITSMKTLVQLSFKPLASTMMGLGNTHKGVYFFAGNSLIIQLRQSISHSWLILSMKELLPNFLKVFIVLFRIRRLG